MNTTSPWDPADHLETADQLSLEELTLTEHTRAVLDYLRDRMPGYPFDAAIDRPFVEELHNDFPHLDILEQIKILRWNHDNKPPLDHKPRAKPRRWVRGAKGRHDR